MHSLEDVHSMYLQKRYSNLFYACESIIHLLTSLNIISKCNRTLKSLELILRKTWVKISVGSHRAA